jgi:excisionase family DNA binding protein
MHQMIRLNHCPGDFVLGTIAGMQIIEDGKDSIRGGQAKSAFLSRREVSRLFGVSVSTVTRWARQGLLKTLRTPGGHYRFPAEETRRAARMGLSERDPSVAGQSS